jgi:hypothetical protein
LLTFRKESVVFQFAIKNLKIKIYRTIILFVFFMSLKLREGRGPRLFEKRMLKRI